MDYPANLKDAVFFWWQRNWLFVGRNCAYPVRRPGRAIATQCEKSPGHGPGGLYCKQHAKKIEKEGN